MDEKQAIRAADPMHGDLLIHFSDGQSVLFQAEYLYEARDADGNEVVPNEAIEPQEIE